MTVYGPSVEVRLDRSLVYDLQNSDCSIEFNLLLHQVK